MQAVVLAGGLATRMRPHTLTLPKSLLEVAGRPFVDWQLERLAASGITDVVFCVAHLGQQIRSHVGDGARFGVRATWSEDDAGVGHADGGPRPKLLGTAGALRTALPLLAPTFVVTYGDSFLPFDYSQPLRVLDQHSDCDGVMAIYKNDGRWDTSNVVTNATDGADATWVVRYEKGPADPAFDHIDYGATALRRFVVAGIPAGKPQGLDVIQRDLARQKRLRAFVARERFFEIGSAEGLGDLDRHLRTRSTS